MAGSEAVSVAAVSEVAASMRETAWREYVETMVTMHVAGALCHSPDSMKWPPEAIAERAVAIARRAAVLITEGA